MVRKRDFILFVVVLLFLVTGIAATVLHDAVTSSQPVSAAVIEAAPPENISVAEPTETKPDHASFIQRMKDKLAAGGADNTPEPVLTYVDEGPVPSASPESGTAGPQLCATEEPVTLTELNWPNSTSFETSEGVRRVISADGKTLMQLPLHGVPGGNRCLGSDVIGIGLAGQLIHNGDTARFQATSENQLIGYARDGFPIYGVTQHTDTLDACGGKTTGTGYHYYIQSGQNYILGCYKGTPAPFIE